MDIYNRAKLLIANGRGNDAILLLDNAPEHSAYWCYLKGKAALQCGWYNEAYKMLQAASELEPTNTEYAIAYNSMFNNGNNYHHHHHHGGGGCSSPCGCCTGLCCADSCCECMGGDFITCC